MVVVFTESLRFTRCLQTEKPTTVMSAKEDNNGKESKEPDYDYEDELEEEQEQQQEQEQREKTGRHFDVWKVYRH